MKNNLTVKSQAIQLFFMSLYHSDYGHRKSPTVKPAEALPRDWQRAGFKKKSNFTFHLEFLDSFFFFWLFLCASETVIINNMSLRTGERNNRFVCLLL